MNSPGKEFFDKVKKLICKFIWDGKRAKVAYKTLIRDVGEGGLKLVDLETKNKALKLSKL